MTQAPSNLDRRDGRTDRTTVLRSPANAQPTQLISADPDVQANISSLFDETSVQPVGPNVTADAYATGEITPVGPDQATTVLDGYNEYEDLGTYGEYGYGAYNDPNEYAADARAGHTMAMPVARETGSGYAPAYNGAPTPGSSPKPRMTFPDSTPPDPHRSSGNDRSGRFLRKAAIAVAVIAVVLVVVSIAVEAGSTLFANLGAKISDTASTLVDGAKDTIQSTGEQIGSNLADTVVAGVTDAAQDALPSEVTDVIGSLVSSGTAAGDSAAVDAAGSADGTTIPHAGSTAGDTAASGAASGDDGVSAPDTGSASDSGEPSYEPVPDTGATSTPPTSSGDGTADTAGNSDSSSEPGVTVTGPSQG